MRPCPLEENAHERHRPKFPRIGLIVAAVLVAAPLASAPAAAQDGSTDTMGATDACAPGPLGEGGTFTARAAGADTTIVRAEIAFQCERMLDDGTYVPGGYRVQLTETCDAGECDLPFVFATELQNDTYSGRYDDSGTPTQVRIRTNRGGALSLTMVSGAGRGSERERERITLRPSR